MCVSRGYFPFTVVRLPSSQKGRYGIMNKKADLFNEIVRFVIIGVYATILDLAIEGWVTSFVSTSVANASHIGAFFIMFAISIVGLIFSSPASWSLTSVWGFQNVAQDAEKKAKSFKGMLIFTFWAFMALLLGAVIQFFAYMICLEWSGWNINILGGFNFDKMFGENGNIAVFWAWAITMGIRTMVTMVFNYLTRKFLIYKAPKEEVPQQN